jgi:hypothetical protein
VQAIERHNLTRKRGEARYAHRIPVIKLPCGLRFRKSSVLKWLWQQETCGWMKFPKIDDGLTRLLLGDELISHRCRFMTSLSITKPRATESLFSECSSFSSFRFAYFCGVRGSLAVARSLTTLLSCLRFSECCDGWAEIRRPPRG